MRPFRLLILPIAALALVTLSASGCSTTYRRSLGQDTHQVFSRIFLTDYNTAWSSVKEALKSNVPDVTNPEGGFIQTRWTDNTEQKNFAESFGGANAFLATKYRLKVTVSKSSFYNGHPAVKVTIQKDQLVQRDVLEGWRPIETDSIEENTLLYRIGRIITIRMRLARLEEERIQKSLEETKFE
ncbi:MAG: hypothetical protein NDJ89_16155 [Oligoflexia bacterium]|nr:hypothetical protein [Oligoflexia bacterium]